MIEDAGAKAIRPALTGRSEYTTLDLMAQPTASKPGIWMPPPGIYAMALAIGLWVNSRWPLPALPRIAGYVMGAALIAAALALIVPSIVRFRQADTPFNVHKGATALVTDGPYRISRNPGYVALTLLYLGISSLLHNSWLFVMVVPAVVVMDVWIIRREERHLAAKFGEDYRRYTASVRRWV
jgi:protein-S-isoprenylcysteine O-methyltransferase Ste14